MNRIIKVQRIVIILLVSALIGMFVYAQNVIDDKDEVIDEYMELVSSYEEDNEDLVHRWEIKYNNLQQTYADKVLECDLLKEELKELSADLPDYSYDYSEIILLAKCVQCLASLSESQKYVTQVILNRVESNKFPNSIEDVIYQSIDGITQFNVAYNGEVDSCVLDESTLLNVYEVLLYGTDLPSYVLFFYTSETYNNWTGVLKVYTVIQGLTFAYKENFA